MTRFRTGPEGKPLPEALQDRPSLEDVEEVTTRTPVPSAEELEAELAQHSGAAGQGDDWMTYRRSL